MKKLRYLLVALLLVTHAAFAAESVKSMFGVELGSRFGFPACERGEDTLTRRHCFNPAHTTKTAWGSEEQHVFFPRTSVVPYARGELTVEVIGGMIEAVHVHTWGIEAQSVALDALKAKYGPPTRSRSEKVKGLRSRFPVQYAEWDMKDFSVSFQGAITSVDWGRITLASPRYLKLRKDQAAQR